jgi:hypothetical protein
MFACAGSSARTAPQQIETDAEAATEGAPVESNEAATAQLTEAGSPDSFRVRLRVDGARSLCAGDCVQLSAAAEQGVAAYSYMFDQGLGSGAGPHRVCPAHTTTYQVTARDSSFEGEFGGANPPAHDAVTIEVLACSEAGVPSGSLDAGLQPDQDASEAAVPDASPRDGSGDASAGDASSPEGKPGVPTCKRSIASARAPDGELGWFDVLHDAFSPKAATDADGNVYFALSYNGAIELFDGTKLSATGETLLVGKLAPDCTPLWLESVRGTRAAYDPTVAVDSHGRLVVLATTGSNSPVNQSVTGALYLTVFSSDGVQGWEKQLESAPGLRWQRWLRIDASDEIVLLAAAAAGSDFGGGPLGALAGGNTLDPTVLVLAKYRANGDHVWSKLIQDVPGNPALAIQNGTEIVVHGWSPGARDWGAGGRTSGGAAAPAHSYLVRANAAGEFVWSKVVRAGDSGTYLWPGLEVTPANQLVFSHAPVRGELSLASASDASISFRTTVVDPALGFGDDWSKTLVDAQSNLVLGGEFNAATSINGVLLTTSQQLSNNVFVQKLAPSGTSVHWTYQSNELDADARASDSLQGISADRQGNVYALMDSAGPTRRTLWLVRLAH